jgi:hypothetical protein
MAPTPRRRDQGGHAVLAFDVERPTGPRDRLSVAFRLILALPIAVLLATVSGWSAGGLLFLGPLLMIVFRTKYPRWWLDWNLQLWRFQNRVAAYVLLLRDEYPATDEEQAVRLDVDVADVPARLNRWLPLVKWFLAIPHYVVLAILWVAVVLVTVVAWFAILITGRYPAGLYDFVTGVLRWTNRVVAYAFVLVTDVYPPFSLR